MTGAIREVLAVQPPLRVTANPRSQDHDHRVIERSEAQCERSRSCNAADGVGEARLSIPWQKVEFFNGLPRLRCAALG